MFSRRNTLQRIIKTSTYLGQVPTVGFTNTTFENYSRIFEIKCYF